MPPHGPDVQLTSAGPATCGWMTLPPASASVPAVVMSPPATEPTLFSEVGKDSPPHAPAVPSTLTGRATGAPTAVPPPTDLTPSVTVPPPAFALRLFTESAWVRPPHGPEVPFTATGAATPGVSAVPPASEPAPPVVAYGALPVRRTDSGVPASARTVLTVFAVALPPQAAAVPST